MASARARHPVVVGFVKRRTRLGVVSLWDMMVILGGAFVFGASVGTATGLARGGLGLLTGVALGWGFGIFSSCLHRNAGAPERIDHARSHPAAGSLAPHLIRKYVRG